MKKFKSHKIVEAGKIKELEPTGDKGWGSALLETDDGSPERMMLSPEYLEKHKPEVGGYFVRYEDGYESFSPAEAFESGYTEVESHHSVDEDRIEEEIQKKGLISPRVTPSDVDNVISTTSFTVLPSKKCMVCELVLKNGFSVTGEASVVSKENFNEELGRDISFSNARDKIWQLEGYLLQQEKCRRASQKN